VSVEKAAYLPLEIQTRVPPSPLPTVYCEFSFVKDEAPGAHLEILKSGTRGGYAFMTLEYLHELTLKNRGKLCLNVFFISSLFNDAVSYSVIRISQ
jgi:hypothetical protein